MPAEKCERCWSRKRLVAREVTADERVDPSVREFVRHYEVGSEEEAFRRLCAEKGFNEHDFLRRARILKGSASARPDGEPRRFSAFLNDASPVGYRYIDGCLLV